MVLQHFISLPETFDSSVILTPVAVNKAIEKAGTYLKFRNLKGAEKNFKIIEFFQGLFEPAIGIIAAGDPVNRIAHVKLAVLVQSHSQSLLEIFESHLLAVPIVGTETQDIVSPRSQLQVL